MDPLASFHARLDGLARTRPQTLLLEGGTEQQRYSMALYWAQLANCVDPSENETPCGECLPCRQIAANEFMDLLIYDGRISNKADDEKPGPIRALRIENMRALKALTGTAPHGRGKRVAVFQGISQLREEALNSLLKTLEEPSSHTLFVLLTPQRQQLLPTLVSRSLCMTLPWTGSSNLVCAEPELESSLAHFLGTGRGFLDKIAAKGALDADGAASLLMACQASLVRCLAGCGRDGLDTALEPVARHPSAASNLGCWIADAQRMLGASVTPARVIEGFASRLYGLLTDISGHSGHS